MTTQPTIEYARHQQIEAAERYIFDQHPGAELGMGDWFAEEFLMLQQREIGAEVG